MQKNDIQNKGRIVGPGKFVGLCSCGAQAVVLSRLMRLRAQFNSFGSVLTSLGQSGSVLVSVGQSGSVWVSLGQSGSVWVSLDQLRSGIDGMGWMDGSISEHYSH